MLSCCFQSSNDSEPLIALNRFSGGICLFECVEAKGVEYKACKVVSLCMFVMRASDVPWLVDATLVKDSSKAT